MELGCGHTRPSEGGAGGAGFPRSRVAVGRPRGGGGGDVVVRQGGQDGGVVGGGGEYGARCGGGAGGRYHTESRWWRLGRAAYTWG